MSHYLNGDNGKDWDCGHELTPEEAKAELEEYLVSHGRAGLTFDWDHERLADCAAVRMVMAAGFRVDPPILSKFEVIVDAALMWVARLLNSKAQDSSPSSRDRLKWIRDAEVSYRAAQAPGTPPQPAASPPPNSPTAPVARPDYIFDPLTNDNGLWSIVPIGNQFGQQTWFDSSGVHWALPANCSNGDNVQSGHHIKDGLLQVEMEYISGQRADLSIFFRQQNPDRLKPGYYGGSKPDAYYALRVILGENGYGGTPSYELTRSGYQIRPLAHASGVKSLHNGPGAKNTIAVRCTGNLITILFNGEEAASIADGTSSAGAIGLGASGYARAWTNERAHVVARNLIVRQ